MKIKLRILIILLILLSVLTNTAKASPLQQVTFFVGQTSYSLDGRLTVMDAVPFVENGRAFVPVRYLALALGVPESKIVWNPSSLTVTLTKGNVKTVMTLDSNIIYINGQSRQIDAIPLMRNDRTYLPARYVAEAFGYEVSWDDSRQAVLIGPPKTSSDTDTNTNNNTNINTSSLDLSMVEHAIFGGTPPEAGTYINSIDLSIVEKALFDRINEDRLAAGLAGVAWDEPAARAARQFAGEMSQNNYISHWNLSGKKPQQRYTEAGGTYGTTENVCFSRLKGYELSQSLVQNNVITVHGEMMAEVPPDDYHRVNILDPHHTHAGVGVAYHKDDDGWITISFTQEFTNHYAEVNGIPKVLKPGESFAVNGSLHDPSLKLYSIVLLWEKAPSPMRIEELKATRRYSSPGPDTMVSYALENWPHAYFQSDTAIGNKLVIDNAGNFTATLQAGERAGLNYLQVWLEDGAGNRFVGNEFVIEVAGAS